MLRKHLTHFRCPAHTESGQLELQELKSTTDVVQDGIFTCLHCGTRYPLLDGVGELIAPALQYGITWKNLRDRHGVTPPSEDQSGPQGQMQQRQLYDEFEVHSGVSYDAFEEMTFWKSCDSEVMSHWTAPQKSMNLVLDVGAGNGRSAQRLLLNHINVVGIDISRSMIERAQARAAGTNRCTYVVADAQQLPVADSAFDGAITSGVLSNLPDPELAVKGILSKVKTSGVYFGLENNKTMFRGAFEWLMKRMALWQNKTGGEPQLSAAMLGQWSAGQKASSYTSVYLPPHAFNLFPFSAALWLLRFTNGLMRLLALGAHGGLLVFQIHKK